MATKFEIRRGDKRLSTPGVWDYPTARAIFAQQGVDPSLCPLKVSGYSEIIPGQNGQRGFCIYPVTEMAPRLKNTQAFYGQEEYLEDQKVTYLFKVIEMDLPDVKTRLYQELSSIQSRDLMDRVEWKGIMVNFDEEAKTNVLGYITEFQLLGESPIEWRGKPIVEKDEEGNVISTGPSSITISSMEELMSLSTTISGRVKASFAARSEMEREVDALIATGDRDAISAINFEDSFKAKVAEKLA